MFPDIIVISNDVLMKVQLYEIKQWKRLKLSNEKDWNQAMKKIKIIAIKKIITLDEFEVKKLVFHTENQKFHFVSLGGLPPYVLY